jgi:hypothetical protein
VCVCVCGWVGGTYFMQEQAMKDEEILA